MGRSFKTEGIIIKRSNFGEADRMVSVFTKHMGKIQVKATGVRRITSRRSSHIELLNHASLTLYKGRSLPTLIEAQTIESFPQIKDDLKKVGAAYHICELVYGLCPDDQGHADVFFLLKETFARLCAEVEIKIIVDTFEVQLLTMLGYWNRASIASQIDTQYIIENLLERRLRSKPIFAKFQ